MRYFITFACYVVRLHGDDSGSVDRNNNVPGSRLAESAPERVAAHVRTNHVHVVVEADVPPEKVIHAFKAYSSRSLNRQKFDAPERKRWARHGSTRWLWTDEDVQESIRYVISGQGEPTETYLGKLL